SAPHRSSAAWVPASLPGLRRWEPTPARAAAVRSRHLNDPDHPQILGAIKEVLARNDLYGLGVDPKGALSPAQAISVQTQMNMLAVHLASLSDQELETYQKLLLELP